MKCDGSVNITVNVVYDWCLPPLVRAVGLCSCAMVSAAVTGWKEQGDW